MRVSSLHDAAQLLARTRAFRDLPALASSLGFAAPNVLDSATREALDATDSVRRASVSSGAGTLRALHVELRGERASRDAALQVATRVANRAPHLLWLVLAVHGKRGDLVVAAPSPGGRTAGVALDPSHVLDSDAETLAAMQSAGVGTDLLVHFRWCELLGRDALTRRFYRELERAVFDLAATATGRADAAARRSLALLCASRLLFLAFLQAKGWLDRDRDFLRRSFDSQCARGGDVHRRLLDPLFFGTLNTPVARRALAARALGSLPFLNGGLFARTPSERLHRSVRFTDESLGALIGGLLARYRVTSREETSSWTEAAVDPEMLGRAFESLMASDDRRATGTFYTPSAIIRRVGDEALREALASCGARIGGIESLDALPQLDEPERHDLAAALRRIRVLDPACGSGSFLVHILERIAELATAAGDTRSAASRRRDVLTRAIFGVDVNPMAVWLCELRLWLSVVIDSGEANPLLVPPLPNLDRNIRVGDALAGAAFREDPRRPFNIIVNAEHRDVRSTLADEGTHAARVMARTRERYARSTGAAKAALTRVLDRLERRSAIAAEESGLAVACDRRRELLTAVRSPDLFARRAAPLTAERAALLTLRAEVRSARRRIAALRAGGPLPFAFAVHFPEVALAGGFDLVIGNPPWVRLKHIPEQSRAALRERFRAFREAAWEKGAAESGAARGFAAQADLASLFIERALEVARPHGIVALLVPAKLWRSLAGGGVRRVLQDGAALLALEDWAESKAAFDAAVYPSFLLTARRESPHVPAQPTQTADVEPVRVQGDEHGRQSPGLRRCVRVAVHRRDDALVWAQSSDSLPLDDSPGAPWLLLPPAVRAGFDRLAAAGTPLVHSPFGRPLLGVKSGCNEAFVVSPRPGWQDAPGESWPVRAADREGVVEQSMLRPLLRGESTRAWHRSPGDDDAILWTHNARDEPLAELPPGAQAWLAPWRRTLAARSDARGNRRWWSLFRTDAARSDCARVVWCDIGLAPRALVLPPGDPTVPLNSCYVVRAATLDDAFALTALLNSPVAAAWLGALAEPARGGYRRFLGWTMSRLPLPADWPRAVELLAPLARAAISGTPPDAVTLTEATLRAFRIRASAVSPLLTWCLR